MKRIDALVDPQTREFVKLCRRYFEFLEKKLSDKKVSEFWTEMLRLLPDIYAKARQLPQIETHYSSDIEKFVSEGEYNKIFVKLAGYFGALDKFADFINLEHPGTIKVVNASLAEILTDIYQELKDFVLLYESGTLEDMNDAIAEFLDSFGKHWGIKLLSAARIIHLNLYLERYADSKKSSAMEVDDADDDDAGEEEAYDNELVQ